MFIKKSEYIKKLERISELESENFGLLSRVTKQIIELEKAQDLKEILSKFKHDFDETIIRCGTITADRISSINLSDDVAIYIDDLFGGKVIKQEANKAIIIEKDGTVKTGYTKNKSDKGYCYKLERK